ncbi:MAG: hypothetical protein DIU75_005155 [Mycolicibacterium hassiacum]|jgi:hypothetical protein
MSTNSGTQWDIHCLRQAVPSSEIVARHGESLPSVVVAWSPLWLLIVGVVAGVFFQYRRRDRERAGGVERALLSVTTWVTQRCGAGYRATRPDRHLCPIRRTTRPVSSDATPPDRPTPPE